MPVLKVKNNGVWEVVGGGSSGGESNVLVVTSSITDESTYVASHSGSEIQAAANAGKAVFLNVANIATFSLSSIFPLGSGCRAIFTLTSYSDLTGEITLAGYNAIVFDDKRLEFIPYEKAVIPVPTESDYGKVLSATAEGLKWTTPVGGSVPSAEGVEF